MPKTNYKQQVPTSPIHPWLEIEVGGRTREELAAAFVKSGMPVTSMIEKLWGSPSWHPGNSNMVRFAKVKIGDLGFTERPITNDLWARIYQVNGTLCEPSDGPALRLWYMDQPHNTAVHVAMNQIKLSQFYYIFELYRGPNPEPPKLFGVGVEPEEEWQLDGEVIFRLRS